jgi:hypothetical protein
VKETVESAMTQVGTEAGPSVPVETGPTKVVEENIEARPSDATKTSKGSGFPTVEASTEGLEFIVRHAAGKKTIRRADCRSYALYQGFEVSPRILGV